MMITDVVAFRFQGDWKVMFNLTMLSVFALSTCFQWWQQRLSLCFQLFFSGNRSNCFCSGSCHFSPRINLDIGCPSQPNNQWMKVPKLKTNEWTALARSSLTGCGDVTTHSFLLDENDHSAIQYNRSICREKDNCIGTKRCFHCAIYTAQCEPLP